VPGNRTWSCASPFADGAQDALAHADDAQLRLYRMDKPVTTSFRAMPAARGRARTPDRSRLSRRSVTTSGAKLRKDLGVPVGLIDCTLGGSTAQAWTPRAALEKNPLFKPMLDESWDKWIAANDDYDAKVARWPQEGRGGEEGG
jgi:sialate O-acetylesterase